MYQINLLLPANSMVDAQRDRPGGWEYLHGMIEWSCQNWAQWHSATLRNWNPQNDNNTYHLKQCRFQEHEKVAEPYNE